MGLKHLFGRPKNRDGSPRLPAGGQTISTEPLVAHDSQGRPLGLGDEVVVLQPGFLFRVGKVEAFSAPGAPPNMMAITLISTINMVVPRGANIDGILRTATWAELKPTDPPQGEQQGTAGDAPVDSVLDPRD